MKLKKVKKKSKKLKKIRKNLKKRILSISFLILILLIFKFLIFGVFYNDIKNYVNFVGKAIAGEDENKNCSVWSECYYTYNLDNENIFLQGEQNRTCKIENSKIIEKRKCIPEKSVTAKKVNGYIEIYDYDGKLVSKLELKKDEIDKLDIEIFP